MSIKHLIRRSARDERGSFSVEAVLMFPMLVWAFMALYVFFEGLRESNINLKATYSIADVLSRETAVINDTYLHNMNEIYGWMARTRLDPAIRVTVVKWDEASGNHELHWTHAVGIPDIPEGKVDQYIDEIISPNVPIMADQAHAIVVESFALYEPIMDIPILPTGLKDSLIYNIVVTMPRFAGKLDYEGMGDGTGSAHDDDLEDETGDV